MKRESKHMDLNPLVFMDIVHKKFSYITNRTEKPNSVMKQYK